MSKTLLSLLSALTLSMLATAMPAQADDDNDDDNGRTVKMKVFRPLNGEISGYDARAYIVSAVLDFKGALSTTGVGQGINPVTGFPESVAELTGPGAHQQLPPFHGTFSVDTNRDHFPGLVVLQDTARFNLRSTPPATPGAFQYTTNDLLDQKNVANLFEITTVIDQNTRGTSIWTDWIQGGSGNFGRINEVTKSVLLVTFVEGVAPAAVTDANSDGKIDEKDLTAMGFKVLSNTVKRTFFVNGCQPGKLILQRPGTVVAGAAACAARDVPVRF